tara:strand:+ start:609 stop:923 length:315 start_codon:yes stop_codon:yes gene_type:complete
MNVLVFKGNPKVSDEVILLKSVLNEIALHFYNTTSFENAALNPIIHKSVRKDITYIVFVPPPLKLRRCYTVSKIKKEKETSNLRKTLTSFMNNLMIAGVNIQYA